MSLSAALEYIRAGFSIFPLSPAAEGKHGTPHIKWADYQTRLPTEDEARAWWAQWPNAGVAIITGRVSGIVVVDVDPRHGGVTKGLPPSECVAETGGGGVHVFYRYPPDQKHVPNQVNSESSPDPVRKGRDVRGDGGYVIAAPSVHHSGKRYRWVSFEPNKLGKPPAWALKPFVSDKDTKGGDKWLSRLIRDGTRPGQRNDDLVRFSGYLASKGVPTDVGLELSRLWMSSQGDPLSEGEVEVTVRSAYRTERRRNPGRFDEKQRESGEVVFKTLTLNQYMLKYGEEELQFMVDGWLPSRTMGFVASPPGGFKTWMTFDVACSVASGRPFLGAYQVNEPGPVLLVQQEDFHGQTAERNALVQMRRLNLRAPDADALLDVPYMPEDSDLPLYFHAERQLRFDDNRIMDALERFIQDVRPKLVICDPFYQLVTTDEYMTKAAKDVERLKTWRDEYGTSFMLVHHTTKSGESEWGRSKMWGSQFLNAWSEFLWHIRRVEDESFNIVKRTFKGGGIQEPIRISFDICPEEWRYDTTPEVITKEEAAELLKAPGRESKKSAPGPKGVARRILQLLATEPEGLRADDIADVLSEEPEKITKACLRLATNGDIEYDALGRWRHAVVDLS